MPLFSTERLTRHASPTLKAVGDVLLLDYIIKVTLPSKSTVGINLLRVR